ncbi:MAG: hypothetical protein OXF74_08580 [Rhodobacteraceae bacterium]|nr:hypothetical protein [Paracoccaceae bacterium]
MDEARRAHRDCEHEGKLHLHGEQRSDLEAVSSQPVQEVGQGAAKSPPNFKLNHNRFGVMASTN